MSRIALVVPGGVDRSGTHRVIPALLWLVRRLARQRDVHVFALRQPSDVTVYRLEGATVHAGGTRRGVGGRLGDLARIIGEHRQAPFDLFHAIWATGAGVVASLAGRLLRRPVIVHLAGGEPVGLTDIGYGGQVGIRSRWQVRVALSGSDRVTAASRPMCEAARRLGYTAQRLPLGVDLEAWPVRAPQPRNPNRPARLLHVGSLNRVKDQRTLLRAAALIKERGLTFHLDVVGVDTLDGQLQVYADELGLRGNVEFHGFLTHDRLRPLVERADLLVMSSRHEAGPVAVLEAAVAGVPCVGTAVGHIAEWAPSAAVAVPIGDPWALAGETLATLADDSRRLRLAAEAQARACAEDADWTALQVERIYSEVLGREG